MNTRPYLVVSGCVFFAVGLLHVLRLLRQWPVQIGPWLVPLWISWLGLAAAWTLAAWAWRLRRE
jgi:hypothetical protein